MFHASSAMRAFCAAVSAVKGGKGGRLMVRCPAACACTFSSCRDASFLEQRVALLGQCFELLGLLRDPVRVALPILGAGVSGGLLDQLPDVVAQDGDARVELGEGRLLPLLIMSVPGLVLKVVRVWRGTLRAPGRRAPKG